jgi:hypothetical protein
MTNQTVPTSAHSSSRKKEISESRLNQIGKIKCNVRAIAAFVRIKGERKEINGLLGYFTSLRASFFAGRSCSLESSADGKKGKLFGRILASVSMSSM